MVFDKYDKPPKNSNHTLAQICCPHCKYRHHYSNVYFVLFHNITCYTNSPFDHAPLVHTTKLFNITFKLANPNFSHHPTVIHWGTSIVNGLPGNRQKPVTRLVSQTGTHGSIIIPGFFKYPHPQNLCTLKIPKMRVDPTPSSDNEADFSCTWTLGVWMTSIYAVMNVFYPLFVDRRNVIGSNRASG